MKHKLISIALIAVLLCMVLVNGIGCNGDGGDGGTTYTLTMSSTAGGSVTPAVGAHNYSAGTVVNLTATPDAGYRFVNWTGNVANANAANTTITMNSDQSVTAHFALGTLIENVPDTNWTVTIPPNYCAPLAMVNILGYWDEVMGDPNAQNVTAWLQPSNLTAVANYVAFFMDTNNVGSGFRGNGIDGHAGTYSKDITPGNVDYVRWDAAHNFSPPPPPPPPALPAGKLGYNWTGVDDHCLLPFPVGFPLIKTEIDAGRPLVVCYTHWNLNFGTNVTDPQTGEVISVYTWGAWSPNSTYPPEQWNDGYGEYGIGHAVTCVGYILNWDPDGSGGLPSGNWTIVHDTWATTPKNVAVPWPGAHHPWNSSHAVLP